MATYIVLIRDLIRWSRFFCFLTKSSRLAYLLQTHDKLQPGINLTISQLCSNHRGITGEMLPVERNCSVYQIIIRHSHKMDCINKMHQTFVQFNSVISPRENQHYPPVIFLL